MGDTTNKLGLYLPGGGSQGAHGADETADIDKINDNFKILDALALPQKDNTVPGAFVGQHTTVAGIEYRWDGSAWKVWERTSSVNYASGCSDRNTGTDVSTVTHAGATGLLIVNAKAGTGDIGSSTPILSVPPDYLGKSGEQAVQGTVRTTSGTVDVYFLNGTLVAANTIPANSYIIGTLPYRFI